MPKLSDTQAALLAAAAARSDLSVLPPPETLRLTGAALERTLKALSARGLIAPAPVQSRAKRSKWADPAAETGEGERLIVTPAGRAAIAAKPGPDRAAVLPESATPARTTKNATLIALLSSDKGADVAALSAALGWQPHTTRAALTRLRHAGYGLEAIARDGGARRYRIVAAPQPPAGA